VDKRCRYLTTGYREKPNSTGSLKLSEPRQTVPIRLTTDALARSSMDESDTGKNQSLRRIGELEKEDVSA